jgi:hypothetical protein
MMLDGEAEVLQIEEFQKAHGVLEQWSVGMLDELLFS